MTPLRRASTALAAAAITCGAVWGPAHAEDLPTFTNDERAAAREKATRARTLSPAPIIDYVAPVPPTTPASR